MTVAFDQLKQDVAQLTTVTESALALIDGLVEKLKTVTTDEELQAVIQDVEADKDKLAAAVAENT